MARLIPLLAVTVALACVGCVDRILTIQSSPPGALVYLNDQEVGRTPLTRRFLWYGTYDVQVRREGYQTLRTQSPVIAPWWQWIPFDFFAELMPARLPDHHTVSYKLTPLSQVQVDPEAMVQRGERLRERLDSSRIPKHAQSQPATAPIR